MKINARRLLYVGIALVVASASGLLYHTYAEPLPALQPVADNTTTSAGATPNISWSPYGEQAFTVVGHDNLMQSYGGNSSLPIASIAKVMTALAILHEKPLSVGEQGPTITMTSNDVAVYQSDLAQNQSVVAVSAGEQLSEYQALEAMLIPSATNIADVAAPWAFGSMDSYLSYANSYAQQIGMTDSHFADASGFSPDTTSTPQDLLKLGEVAMQNPVIASIVSQASVTLPVAGTVNNFNADVGQGGINGIKTGNTDQAGGALLLSAKEQGYSVIGIILDAPDLGTAVHDAPEVLDSYTQTIQVATVISAGQVVGKYTLPWGGTVNAVAKNSVSAVESVSSTPGITVSLQPIHTTTNSSQTIGTVSLDGAPSSNSAVTLQNSIPQPSVWWRMTHHR